MNKGTKKQLLIILCLFIPLIGFVVFIKLGLNQREKQLERESAYTTAVIIDTYVGTKVREFVKYEFEANSKHYVGHQQYFPKIESVSIGDTCEVVYAKSNPEINKLITDKDRRLRIKRTTRQSVTF